MSVTIKQLLVQSATMLQHVTDQPQREAELLLSYVLNQPRTYLHAWSEQIVIDENLRLFQELLARRLQQEPLAYIVGKKEFWSLDLDVNYHTLIPRPETELLVEVALQLFQKSVIKMADLGTGSGAVALALAKEQPQWQIVATDISAEALKVAQQNAKNLHLTNIMWLQGNWCDVLSSKDFDLIISNPPYIAEQEWAYYATGLTFEPVTALVSGVAGLDAIASIIQQSKQYLKPQGVLMLEHGFAQAQAVRDLFLKAGYSDIATRRDLAGHERVTMAKTAAFA